MEEKENGKDAATNGKVTSSSSWYSELVPARLQKVTLNTIFISFLHQENEENGEPEVDDEDDEEVDEEDEEDDGEGS